MAAVLHTTTLKFLKDLSKNNNREWFIDNKNQYNAANENMVEFVENLIEEIGKFDEKVLKLDAKKSLFRIYRDTRFSKDKTPYKTNFGAGLGMGKGGEIAGYYLHIEPGNSFLAGGVYQPDTAVLKEIRKEISMNHEDFNAVISDDNFRKYFNQLAQEDKLTRVPQGFEKDDKMAEFLKLKNIIAVYTLKDEEVTNPNAVKNFATILRAIKPLNDFLSAPFK